MLGDLTLCFVIAFRRRQFLFRKGKLGHADMHLTHDGHRQGQALRLQDLFLRVDRLQPDGMTEQVEKIPAHLRAIRQPVVMKQERIVVVVLSGFNGQIGKQFQNRRFCLLGIDSLLVVHPTELRAIEQGLQLHVLQAHLHLGQGSRTVGDFELIVLSRGKVHQGRKLKLRSRELPVELLDLALAVDQVPPIAQLDKG